MTSIPPSPLYNRPDYVVCTCMEVFHSQIVKALDAGDTTFEKLSQSLGVGTGCSSCVEEVHAMIKEWFAQRNKHSY